jgi:hypothetical protein
MKYDLKKNPRETTRKQLQSRYFMVTSALRRGQAKFQSSGENQEKNKQIIRMRSQRFSRQGL